MKLIKSSYQITKLPDTGALKDIEVAARTCYKSEDKITEDDSSAKILVEKLIKRGHFAMIEFADMTVKFICDRGVSHELVRHRLCSFAQESTRYCNYGKDEHMQFIIVEINHNIYLSEKINSRLIPFCSKGPWLLCCGC